MTQSAEELLQRYLSVLTPATTTDEAEKVASGAVTLSNMWRHPDAHPIVLSVALLQKYGSDWLLWEPETLRSIVPGDFGTQSLSDINLTKVQAMRTLHLVDTFWLQWEVFGWCTVSLNGVFPDFGTMQVPTVAQCMVAVDIANRVREDVSWSDELRGYLSAVHLHDDVLCPQSPLDFVKVDTEGFPVDIKKVEERWPSVRTSGRAPTEETIEAEQLRRMLIVHDYLEESRARLERQLRLLSHA